MFFNEIAGIFSNPFFAFLLFFVAIGLLLELIGLLATSLFRVSRPPALQAKNGVYPGVSILKPCRENSDNEQINYEAFFTQKYPGKFELIFVVGAENDPIVPVIKHFFAKYPAVEARYIISTTETACSPKVNALYDGHCASKYEIVIWSDSDTIVRENYLSQVVGSLQAPGVSLVTTPQYDTRANNFGSAFKVMANNADVAVFVMAYWLLNRVKKIAWGHSIGFWKKDLENIPEAWPFLNRFFADDLGIPLLFSRHHKKVVFQNIYCPVECANKSVREMITQKKRWILCQRFVIGNKFLYLSGALFYPQIPATFLLLATQFSLWSIYLFLAVAFSRIFISAFFELLYLSSLRMSVRYFWTILLWDLSQLYFFWYGFKTKTIVFRGKNYRVSKDYSLTPTE